MRTADERRRMLDGASLRDVLRSYSRISSGATFYEEFYENLTQDVRVADHFRNVGLARRAFFLKTAIPTLIMSEMGSHVAQKRMRRLAEKHSSHHLNVEPILYEIWHDTLIALLWKYDDDFNKELESLWSTTIHSGVKLFIEEYSRC